MKKQFQKLALFFMLIMALGLSVSAQIYVRVRPAIPVIVRPPQPSPVHVWIGEEWEPRGGTYAYIGGHWAAPPRPGFIWVTGHWRRHGRDGEVWMPGHWRRR